MAGIKPRRVLPELPRDLRDLRKLLVVVGRLLHQVEPAHHRVRGTAAFFCVRVQNAQDPVVRAPGQKDFSPILFNHKKMLMRKIIAHIAAVPTDKQVAVHGRKRVCSLVDRDQFKLLVNRMIPIQQRYLRQLQYPRVNPDVAVAPVRRVGSIVRVVLSPRRRLHINVRVIIDLREGKDPA